MCPECEAEVVIHGDVAVEYIVSRWVRQSGGEDHHHETPPGMAALLDHEHEPSNFREKTTGLPFLSQELSGMRAFGPASRWEDRP